MCHETFPWIPPNDEVELGYRLASGGYGPIRMAASWGIALITFTRSLNFSEHYFDTTFPCPMRPGRSE